ncbi:hypothetical protein L3Q82_018396, partial [Scortum barcoo]
MDISLLREQYRCTKETRRRNTQVLLFRTVSEELSEAVSVFPITQGLTSSWEPNSSSPPALTFDPDPTSYDPWHVHLGLHRRSCPRVTVQLTVPSSETTNSDASSRRSLSSSEVVASDPPSSSRETSPCREEGSSERSRGDLLSPVQVSDSLKQIPSDGSEADHLDGSLSDSQEMSAAGSLTSSDGGLTPVTSVTSSPDGSTHQQPTRGPEGEPVCSVKSQKLCFKRTMAELNIEAKLKNQLKQEKIQLWNPPYTDDSNQPGQQHMQNLSYHHTNKYKTKELAERYALLLALPVSEVGGALESIRAQAVKRGKGNKTFRETNVATLELLLPRDSKKDPKTKNYLETTLDVLVQEVMDRIAEEYGLKPIKLILNGKNLSVDQRLDEQGVKNNSKMMVLKVTDAEWKQQQSKEEEKTKRQNESIQRTQKGFQILSERVLYCLCLSVYGSEDPDTTPFLEIADQKGNPLKIPHKEKKALILAMGFHEKGRSLMKKKQFDNALCHLLQADQQFSKCGSALLTSVDNYAVLQLDIVWCYRALEALSCLDDGKSRLQRAEDCFQKCYGEQQQRLLMIKGNTGREEVLFLRLYLLQSLLSYIEGNDAQARHQLSKVESLYSRLCLDSEKMAQLMVLGFTEREARLGLRACQGDLQEAAIHISNQRQEREELKERERQKRSTRMEVISTLAELGFPRRDAARALHLTEGDVDKAYGILLDSNQAAQATNNNTEGAVSPEKVEQLLYLGFERDVSEAALRLTGGDVQSATQLLLDNQGVLSPELLSASPPSTSSSSSLHSPSSEEPSTSSTENIDQQTSVSADKRGVLRKNSSNFPPLSSADNELVNEVLEDISRHEEDYLDLTLEEESELIATMKSYLNRGPHTLSDAPLYLGFDFSTQQLKVVAIDGDLNVVHQNNVQFDSELPEFRLRCDWLVLSRVRHQALDLLLDKMKRAGLDFSRVRALSGSGQQHGSVYWRRGASETLRRLDPDQSLYQLLQGSFSVSDSPVWMDSSSSQQCQDLQAAAGGALRLAEITGSRA